MKIITYGDSIFHGDGVDQRDNIPSQIGAILGADVKNAAISGAGWSVAGGTDSLAQVDNNPNTGYDLAILEFGVNNYGWPAELDDVRYAASQTIRAIQLFDFNTDILIVLPGPDFRWRNGGNVPSLDDKNSKGWSQNDLINMLIEVANQWNASYWDWRTSPVITYDNAVDMLQEGQKGVHPTAKGATAEAQAIAKFVKDKKLGQHSVQPFVTQTSPQGVTQVVANPDYVVQQSQPVEQPKVQIKLASINSSSELIGVFNSNMTLIYKALEFNFIPQTFVDLNRGSRNYIVDSVNELKMLLGLKFNGISYMNDDGSEVTMDGLVTPESLLVDEVISDLNKDWKILENFINTVNAI